MTTIEQWQAGGGVPGAPPWDGTGIPFPVNGDGVPVIPGAGKITVTPNSTQTVAHDDPNVEASPLTAWDVRNQWATFTDGTWTWDGAAWVAYVPTTVVSFVALPPTPAGSSYEVELTTSDDPGTGISIQTQISPFGGWSLNAPMTQVDPTHYRFTVDTTQPGYVEGAAIDHSAFGSPAEDGEDAEARGYLSAYLYAVPLSAPVLDEGTLSGWSVGELRQFAADHNPPIVIPAGTHKAQIIALILAALAADEDETP